MTNDEQNHHVTAANYSFMYDIKTIGRCNLLKKQWFADLTLLFVAFVWGATFVVVQNAISFLPPITFNSIRFFLAAVLLGGWLVLFQRQQIAYLNKRLLLAGFLGLWLFFGYATKRSACYTQARLSRIYYRAQCRLVPLFAFVLLKQRPGKNAVAGIVVAVIGLYLLTMTDISAFNKGDALVFLCSIGFAMQIVLTGKYSKQFPTLLLTVVQISTVSGLSVIYAFFLEDWKLALDSTVLFQPDVIFALVITSLFATAFAFCPNEFSKIYITDQGGPYFATEPVFAALTGFLWAGDRLSASAVIEMRPHFGRHDSCRTSRQAAKVYKSKKVS